MTNGARGNKPCHEKNTPGGNGIWGGGCGESPKGGAMYRVGMAEQSVSRPSMTRVGRAAMTILAVGLATPCPAEPAPNHVNSPQVLQNSFIDLLALMSGHCKTFKVAGRTFACKTVAYAHGDKGRVNFAVAVDDPADDSHVVSFSGENGKRADDNSYELRIDRMLLNSKHRPKVDGLPVPAEQSSTGLCRQTGNFAARKVNDVTCSATDSEGRRYELLFVSDGTPVSVRRIRQSAPSIQDPFK